jgi:ketosteroid isomerase-like protein
MAQEALRVLRDIYGSRTLEDAAELMHPQVEMRQARDVPDTDDYYGREELVRGTNRWLEEWEDFRFIAEDLADLGGQHALARVQLKGRARASGIELDQVVFHLWTFRDSMPWRCEVFLDEQAAAEAARGASTPSAHK